MTKADFDVLFNSILDEIRSTRSAGQKEYAHGEVDDVFNNFNRVASAIDLDRKKVLFTYLSKHIDGVTAYIKGHKSQREDVRGRIKDIMVYCALLWGMIEEEERELVISHSLTKKTELLGGLQQSERSAQQMAGMQNTFANRE